MDTDLSLKAVSVHFARIRRLYVGFIGALLLCGVTTADLYLDRMAQYDFLEASVYLLPVAYVAWTGGTRMALCFALASLVCEATATYLALARWCPGKVWPFMSILIPISIAVLFTAALVVSRLRYHVKRSGRRW